MEELKQKILNAVTCFYTEYEKAIKCAALIGFLYLLQWLFKYDLSGTITDLMDYLKYVLMGAVVKFSVNTASEKKKIQALPPVSQMPVDEFKGSFKADDIRLELSGENLHIAKEPDAETPGAETPNMRPVKNRKQ